MSMHDMTLNFANGLTLPVTASTTTSSKIIDFRGTGGLELWIMALLRTAPSQTVTTKVMTSQDGTSWTEKASQANDGATLFKGRLPEGLKRYVKLTFTVGATALSAAGSVFAEITDSVNEELDTDKVNYAHTDTAAEGDEVTAVD